MSASYKILARVIKRHIFLLVAVVAFLLTPWLVGASTIKYQVFNDSQFLWLTGTPLNYFVQELGLFATGTSAGGVQIQFSTTNTIPDFDRISVVFQEWADETAFNENPINGEIRSRTCQSGVASSTDASGYLVFNCPFTFQGYPYYYAFTVQDGGATKVTNIYSILGTTISNGSKLYIGYTPTTATTTNNLYYQIFSGNSATAYFTPDPAFSGFATTTLSEKCEPPSNILDVGGGVRYGLCAGMSFLFVPTPASLSQFSGLGTAVQTKFPFQYFYSIKDTLDDLVASTTANAPTYTYNLHDPE